MLKALQIYMLFLFQLTVNERIVVGKNYYSAKIFPLRRVFCTTAQELYFRCVGIFVPLRWYDCTKAVKIFWYYCGISQKFCRTLIRIGVFVFLNFYEFSEKCHFARWDGMVILPFWRIYLAEILQTYFFFGKLFLSLNFVTF